MSFLGLGRRAIAHLSPLVGASPSRCLSRSAVANSGDALYVHRDSAENNSDIVFEFNAENKKRAEAIMSIYPDVSNHYFDLQMSSLAFDIFGILGTKNLSQPIGLVNNKRL